MAYFWIITPYNKIYMEYPQDNMYTRNLYPIENT